MLEKDLSNLSPREQKQLRVAFAQMVDQAKEDPVYFINQFCYTFNPKQKPFHLHFKLYPYQEKAVRDMVKHIDDGKDLFIEKSREMGATYMAVCVALWYWLFSPASNILFGSRKEDYVDNRRGGVTGNKEESLFGKLDYVISRLPSFILPKGFNPNRNFTYMSLVNPENGNVIGGESSNANFSRGGRQKFILLDEFAFWDNDFQAWGATADTTRSRIVITTPGIRPCKAKRLRFGKDDEKIDILTLLYTLDPRKNAKWLAEEKTRRSELDFNREIMLNWETSIQGRVYPEIDNAKIGEYPYITGEQVYCSWDFGLDGTAFSFWQLNRKNGKWRLIDSYENIDKVIQFFLPFFGKPIESVYTYNDDDLLGINEIKEIPKSIHYGDPDVNKRSLQTGITTKQILAKAGIYVQNLTKNDFYTRREATKIELQKGIEINQNRRNEYALECLKAARYPQRQETSDATTPIAQPVHDWTSHMRTSWEYFFVNIKSRVDYINKPAFSDQRRKWRTSRRSYAR